MPASRPSLPGDSHPRRLGVGGGSSGNDRFLRAQIIIATVFGISILAVLLYLLRRPSGAEHEARDDAAEPSASALAAAPSAIVRTSLEAPQKAPVRVKVGTVQRQRC